MTIQQEIKKNWPKAKKELEKLGKEALIAAEEGKKQFVRFSKQSKLRLDITSLELKKEHLYYLIGKEFVKENCPGTYGDKLKKFIDDLKQVNREQGQLKKLLESKKAPDA